MAIVARLFWGLVQTVFACVLLGSAIACYFIYLMFAPAAASERATKYTLTPGSTAATVASDLESQRLIKSALAFRLLARATRASADLRAGEYKLSPSMSPYQILDSLRKGPPEAPGVIVTIPEGKTTAEVAAIVAARTGIPERDFILLAQTPRKLFPERTWLPERATAEGYLFPDTYTFVKDTRASQVIDKMLKRYEEVVLPVIKASGKPVGRIPEVMTMASLVESEAQVAGERARIASVYFNRLKYEMRLECDATVQYALPRRKPILTYADLRIESPYNTYLNAGLPPGPICNPGLASVQAALKPAKTEYLYYVRNDVKNDGSHVFTQSFAEHNDAIRRYQK